MNKIEVINRLKPIAYNLRSKNRWLDGKLSMAMAQIVIESKWLKSAPGNNCLGIKVPKDKIDIWKNKQLLWTKEWDASKGKYIDIQAWFMTYSSIEDCIKNGYIRILDLDRYKETRDCVDWWDATNYIRINGYATSPVYTNTLRNLILKEKLYSIDWYHGFEEKITENFKWGETYSNVRFNGKTYKRIIEAPKPMWIDIVDLAIELQKGRNFIGQPFIVTNNGGWYRMIEYNFQAGGASDSQHLYANGVDIYAPKGFTVYEFYKIMRMKTNCTGYGLGIKDKFLHIDRKKNVKIRVWYC